MDIIDVLEKIEIYPQKESARSFCSPCPYCKDGHDRFIIWPSEGRGGRFLCRVCDEKGDAINLLRDHWGLTFQQACEKLNIEPGLRLLKPQQRPLVAENPSNAWIDKATAFVEWCHTKMIGDDNLLSALKKERGITKDTIKRFKLGYNPETYYGCYSEWGMREDGGRIWAPPGIVIPTFEERRLCKIKIRNADFGRCGSKYVIVKGSKKCPSVYGDESIERLLVLESELDGILMMQEIGDLCFCLALGGSTQPLDLHKEQIVNNAGMVIFCPDFDLAGKESWDRWVKRFPDTRRILTKFGKDPTEDLIRYGVDLREWIAESIF